MGVTFEALHNDWQDFGVCACPESNLAVAIASTFADELAELRWEMTPEQWGALVARIAVPMARLADIQQDRRDVQRRAGA